MELHFDYWKGGFSNIRDCLIRSISQYTRHYKVVKIGITCNPKRRMNQHQRNNSKWLKMVVKYETTSVRFINDMERILIDYHWEFIVNEAKGGGGRNGNPPYYLYVLLE